MGTLYEAKVLPIMWNWKMRSDLCASDCTW